MSSTKLNNRSPRRSPLSISSTFTMPAGVPVEIELSRFAGSVLVDGADVIDVSRGAVTLVPTIHFTRMDGRWWRLFVNEDPATACLTGREIWLRDESLGDPDEDDESVPSTALCVGIAGEE